MKSADIFIIGTGSLAGGIVNCLSQTAEGPLRIAIIGRSMAKASRIASLASARAAVFGTSTTFLPIAMAPFKALPFSRASRSLKPKVIFHLASLQSPWEAGEGPNGWTRLVASAGFGITLPLQLALASEISRGASDCEAAIVNASYPDCVNVALQRLGLRTTCGIGNCAIVEAFCRSRAKAGSGEVRVVGHHGQLGGWMKGNRTRSQPRIWVKGREIEPLSLRPNLGDLGDELNGVTCTTAIPLILALLTGGTLKTSIPGVGRLPGGYPFVLKRGKFKLRLPAGITQAEAIAHNKKGECLDGLDLESGVRFVGKARRALASAGFEYAQGFDLAEWPAVLDKMLLLRERLRKVAG